MAPPPARATARSPTQRRSRPTIQRRRSTCTEESPVQTLDRGIEIHDVSWASLGTDRVSAWLVVPPGGGPFAGLVYLHGSETDRDDFLDEAVAMARGGAASIVMDAPFARTGTSRKAFLLNFGLAERERDMTAQTVLDLRRAYDVLLEREDVDAGASRLRRPFLGRLAGSCPCRGRRASGFAGDDHRLDRRGRGSWRQSPRAGSDRRTNASATRTGSGTWPSWRRSTRWPRSTAWMPAGSTCSTAPPTTWCRRTCRPS